MLEAVAAYSRDEGIRIQSSSGGLFSILARQILKEGGIVFGAAYDEDFHVNYCGVDKMEELYRLRGAKYIESNLGNVYTQIQENLNQDRKVLFCGLPCHVAGLLRKVGNQEKLVCVDMVCHGVPPEWVWDAYLKAYQSRKGKITRVFMRDKRDSWIRSHWRIETTGVVYLESSRENLYMRGFVEDLYLRTCCYGCKFKGISRESDLTLGDYWGISRIHPGFADDKGVSLVLIQSEKGKQLFQDVSRQLCWVKSDIRQAARHNPSLVLSAVRPRRHEKIMEELKMGYDFISLMEKNLKTSIINKVMRKIRGKTTGIQVWFRFILKPWAAIEFLNKKGGKNL